MKAPRLLTAEEVAELLLQALLGGYQIGLVPVTPVARQGTVYIVREWVEA